MKKSKFLISDENGLKNKKTLSGVKAKVKDAYVAGRIEIVVLTFDYENQQQVDAMNKLYGNEARKSYSYSCVISVGDDIDVCCISNDGTKVDLMYITFDFDDVLNAVLQKLIEKDGITLTAGATTVKNMYDANACNQIHHELIKMAKASEKNCSKDEAVTK